MVDDRERVEQIKSRLDDPLGVCEALGIAKRHRRQPGDGLIICCPAHNEKHPSCSVRRVDGRIAWKCFSCSASGDVLSLIACANGLDVRGDFGRVLEIAAEMAGVELEDRPARKRTRPIVKRAPVIVAEPTLSDEQFAEVVAPLETIGRLDGRGMSARVCEYLDKRGLLESARCDGWFAIDATAGQLLCDVFGLERAQRCGLVDEFGELKWPENILAIPWRNPHNVVQTIQRRHLGDCDARKRYMFPTNRGPSHPYGIEHLQGDGPIALVEGAADVLAWRLADRCFKDPRWETPLGVPGVSGWKGAWDAIAKDRWVVIAYDDDGAGNREALKLGDRLWKARAFNVVRGLPFAADKDWAEVVQRSA